MTNRTVRRFRMLRQSRVQQSALLHAPQERSRSCSGPHLSARNPPGRRPPGPCERAFVLVGVRRGRDL